MKQLVARFDTGHRHWVGDGFPVRSLFSYQDDASALSPFLLLDHAGPAEFTPTTSRRGVGQHPHRGFETVTIVYEGELAHRDSSGGGGEIGPGDVQWMTAGAGIIHEEFHSERFGREGGHLEMVQLWVNLPARDKMTPPAYQTLLNTDIPRVTLPGEAGQLRVIAGSYRAGSQSWQGPAKTFTPINLWDVTLSGRQAVDLTLPPRHNAVVLVRKGRLLINDITLEEGQLAVFDRNDCNLRLDSTGHTEALLMSGTDLDEPVVGYGPFVMNSEQEIRQAIHDFNAGRFGRVTAGGQ